MECGNEEYIFHWEELLSLMATRFKDEAQWIFRGHGCANWDLKTSLERTLSRWDIANGDFPILEKRIIREFKRHYRQYALHIPQDEDHFEWLSIMQHYLAPTRLLDWTYSFYVAVFLPWKMEG